MEPDLAAETISHYRILEKLDESGMGVVYKAEDTTLRRAVPFKSLPPEMMRDPGLQLWREAPSAACGC